MNFTLWTMDDEGMLFSKCLTRGMSFAGNSFLKEKGSMNPDPDSLVLTPIINVKRDNENENQWIQEDEHHEM